MSRRADVAVAVVTWDSAEDLPGCLEAVGRLRDTSVELIVVDCGSLDGSPRVARELAPPAVPTRVVELGENRGFAAAMNLAVRESAAPFVLSLNPDARPEPDYAARLQRAIERRGTPRLGAATGRLVRPAGGGEPPRLDACGMRLTLTWRHLDRGSGQEDRGQWQTPELVFGATGAASLFRRAALEDVSVDGEVFAEDFHSYREDAELCFRLQERGWGVLYEPRARAVHRRRNVPGRRSAMPAAVNYHSLKNRYLLRAWHGTPANLALTLLPAFWRDLLALGYVLARERESLAAYSWLWRERRRILERRRRIQGRRSRPAWEIDRWFLRQGLPR